MLTSIKNWFIAGQLKRLFSKDNLLQPSTIKSLIGFCVTAGLFTMSPELQDQTATVIVQFIAAGQGLMALVNFFRNENKPKPLPWLETQPKE